jgi:hypothetical protein
MSEQTTLLTPRQLREAEAAKYEEMKRLAEMAWAAILASPSDGPRHVLAEAAWENAEAMYAESERRRPVE